jgi:CRISPR-associated protein Cas1
MTGETTVYVKDQGAVVRKRGERLVVTKDHQELMDLPLMHVRQLAVVGNVQLTTPAIAALLQNEVDVVFFSQRLKYRGRLMAGGSKFAQLRHAQLQAMSDEARALDIARQVVLGKLTNQRVVLQRRLAAAQGSAAGRAMQEAVDGIGTMRQGAVQARSLDSLRGYEGKAGAYYFAAYKAMLNPAWNFQGRAYYPPPDPINSALSLGYSLLLKDTIAAIQLVGLDPYLGFFHVIEYARPSLALDVMEEFRPILVDTLILELVQRQRLTPAQFVRTGRQERPVEMSEAGLQLLLRTYEERLATRVQHPTTHEQTTYRRCLELQARQLASIVLGKQAQYVPMVIR